MRGLPEDAFADDPLPDAFDGFTRHCPSRRWVKEPRDLQANAFRATSELEVRGLPRLKLELKLCPSKKSLNEEPLFGLLLVHHGTLTFSLPFLPGRRSLRSGEVHIPFKWIISQR